MTSLSPDTLLRELPDGTLEQLTPEGAAELGFPVFEEVLLAPERRDDAYAILYAWKRGEIELPRAWTERLEQMLVELGRLDRIEREERKGGRRYDDPEIMVARLDRHMERLHRSWIGQRLMARLTAPKPSPMPVATSSPRAHGARRCRSRTRASARLADSDEADPAPPSGARVHRLLRRFGWPA